MVSEHRDREAMQRGQCNSLLSFAYDRLTNYLLIKATHEDAHPPYLDKTIPMMVREFIKGNVRHSPAQIYQMMLREEGLEEHITDVTVPQVRYFWHNLTCQTWLRDKDPLLSAQIYANEVERTKCLLLTCPGYKGLLLINMVATSHLSRPGLVQELTMDATYGTNSGAYNLFAVLAEVDGTGIPLAYVFAKPTGDRTLSTSAPLMELLHQVLSRVREEGFDPAFFGCDKDLAEIAAISFVFPNAKIQLCYWHVLRAIRSKLKSYAATSGHIYDPQQANLLVPELEVCWGSRIDKRTTGHRLSDHCACPSRNSSYSSPGRLEPSTVTERDAVLNMIYRHFNYHSAFPFQLGVMGSPDSIHAMCASEMYTFCRKRDWWRTWAYFWTEWYADKWKYWARSVHVLLPVLKTTMVLESDWRLLKQDFLHRYNRPRMDLVVHCIVTELLPAMDRKMVALLASNQRIYKADWRKEFKKTWLDARNTPLGTQTRHTTDISKWVCSCTKFVLSRFLLCKHLVQKRELTGPVSAEYFRNVRRIRAPPFWVLPGDTNFPVFEMDELPANVLENKYFDEELLDGEEADSEAGVDLEPTPAEEFEELKATCAEFLELIEKESREAHF